MATNEPGLRELKKQITREAIADAARQLALGNGLDHVTLDEIAHVAFVSPRTVSNYFSCKEEAIVAAGARDVLAIATELAQRPVTEAPMQSLRLLLVDFASSRTGHQLRVGAQTIGLAQLYEDRCARSIRRTTTHSRRPYGMRSRSEQAPTSTRTCIPGSSPAQPCRPTSRR